MHLTLLGTGTSQGVPVIGCTCKVCASVDPRDQRLRTSALCSIEDVNIGIDCGPDFRQQMLSASVQELQAILITHTHNDHVAGLDDVRPFNFSMNRHMPIYGLKEHIDDIRNRFEYIFEKSPYPGAPRIDLIEIEPYVPFEIHGIDILPMLLRHGALDVLGYRIQDKAYLTDTNHIPERSLSLLKDLQILVLDALHHREHHSHFNLEQAIAVAETINADRTFLIHVSHHMGLHREIEDLLPANIHLGYDGLIL